MTYSFFFITQTLKLDLATANALAAIALVVTAPFSFSLVLCRTLMLFATMVYGPMAALLVELFPPQIRYGSVSTAYNIGNGWFGGFTSPIAFALIAESGDIYAGTWYCMAITSLTLIVGGLFLRPPEAIAAREDDLVPFAPAGPHVVRHDMMPAVGADDGAFPTLTLLRVADQRPQPWKNGGGVTTELACRPRGATFATFDWRVSMARVEVDGPFSLFAGVQRILAVIEGEGLHLEIAGETLPPLSAGSDPLDFAGDVPVNARLLAGPIVDLNLMSRRDRFASRLLMLSDVQTLAVTADTTGVFVAVGGAVQIELSFAAGSRLIALDPGDACVIDDGLSYTLHLRAEHGATCYAALGIPLPFSTGADSPPPSLPHPSAP